MSLREKGKARRKQQILDAVVTLLQAEGFNALSTSRIAEEAEVSVATLYNLMGSIDSILDVMVEQLFGEFESAYTHITRDLAPLAIIEGVSEAAYSFLKQDEPKYKAVLKAVFQINVSRDLTAPVFHTAQNNRTLFISAIRQLQDSNAMMPGLNTQLLAEQMLITQVMLLENWSAGVISLERFRLTSKFHFLLLIKAWANPDLAIELQQKILEIQGSIEALMGASDARKRRPQAAKSGQDETIKTRIEKEVLSYEDRSLQEAGS
ncbi:TetR/AcrR family transcriptional regulator [Endozoicomonas arenosclerae]|uniref:TetR/AcrR family transcriptional regulator n=1 Tax=Endozoicomonas arenosclerae TaxID=1633495 RepID=UPI000785A840|nr:TetR/AcrR family transcriptional regulator [Endozoicomonas arenosclerae]